MAASSLSLLLIRSSCDPLFAESFGLHSCDMALERIVFQYQFIIGYGLVQLLTDYRKTGVFQGHRESYENAQNTRLARH